MSTRLECLSYDVARQVVVFCDVLVQRKVPYPLINQFIKSGTSVAANIAESRQGQSRPDFAAKLAIASKEAQETYFWLRLLRDTGKVSIPETEKLMDETLELCKMLASACKTLSRRISH